jgi:hypothetical protein
MDDFDDRFRFAGRRQRIKELHEQHQELLTKKQALDRARPGVKTAYATPTAQMEAYEMRRRLLRSKSAPKGILTTGRKGGQSARPQIHPT